MKKIKHRWTPSVCKCKIEFYRTYQPSAGGYVWDTSKPDEFISVTKCAAHASVPDAEVKNHIESHEEKLKNFLADHIYNVHGIDAFNDYLENGWEFTGSGKTRVLKIKTDKLLKKYTQAEKKAMKDFVKGELPAWGVPPNKEIDI